MPDRATRPKGRRPPSPAPGGRAEEIEERRTRALEEPLDVRRLPGTWVRLEVRNPIHGTHYRVFFPAFPSRDAALCTCADFSRSGLGTCKHVEAAWHWISERPEEARDPDPSKEGAFPSWEEIDRRRHHPPKGASPARRMTWVGEAMVR